MESSFVFRSLVIGFVEWNHQSFTLNEMSYKVRAGFKRGACDPGSQLIIKAHRKSLLELPYLTFKLEVLYNFPANKNGLSKLGKCPLNLRKYTFNTHFYLRSMSTSDPV